jgi:DNA polymerase III alpha subunit
MTMWAQNARGLRNLFKLSSLASIERCYMKRMDRELISQNAEGIIATTGCPSGEVQTRLRLGQYEAAVKAAGAYQDIFGKENYFLELMDHGLGIEQIRSTTGKMPRMCEFRAPHMWPSGPLSPRACSAAGHRTPQILRPGFPGRSRRSTL